MSSLADLVVSVPDFPKPGILFRDIMGVLRAPGGITRATDAYCKLLEGLDFDVVAGMDSRGFLFAAPIADRLGKPLLCFRKPGKLPRETIRETYDLEYGQNALEVHREDLRPGQRVVIVDDLLATGGTALAAAHLVERLGGVVAKIVFLLELVDLGGREKLAGHAVGSVLEFPGH